MNLEENIILDTDSIALSLKEFLKQEGIIKLLTKKGDTLVNKSISSRMLNHWEELNLIDNNRENGKGWRKFSILDSVWMEIILELRNFGFPNDKILNVKNHFLNTEGNVLAPGRIKVYGPGSARLSILNVDVSICLT